jgi:drug/metabolite transporter (DMT)-like permease
VFLAAFFWGSTATLARSVFRDLGVPALVVVELRLAIAATLLLAWLALRHRDALRVERRDAGYLLVLGLFGVAAVQGSYYFSIARLGVGLAILLQYVAPALILLWEMARGARPTPATVIAVILALGGTALLVNGMDPRASGASPLDWLVGASSAVIFAFYVLYSKRGLARYRPETLLFYTFGVAALFWACVTPPWRILATGYPAEAWWRFLLLGVFSTLVPFRCFYAGLKRLPASEAGLIATSEPVIAIVAAALFLGESLRPIQMLGAVTVIAGAFLASRDRPEAVEAIVERG